MSCLNTGAVRIKPPNIYRAMLLDATNKDNLATFETIQWSTRSLTIHHTIKSL